MDNSLNSDKLLELADAKLHKLKKALILETNFSSSHAQAWELEMI